MTQEQIDEQQEYYYWLGEQDEQDTRDITQDAERTESAEGKLQFFW